MFDFIAECLKSERDTVLCTCGHFNCKMYSHPVLWVPLCFSSYRLQLLEKEKFGKFCGGCWLCTDIMAVGGMSTASPRQSTSYELLIMGQ